MQLVISPISMVLQSLDDKTRLSYYKKYHNADRDVLIITMLDEINDVSTALGSAYANSELCKIDPTYITSSDATNLRRQTSICFSIPL